MHEGFGAAALGQAAFDLVDATEEELGARCGSLLDALLALTGAAGARLEVGAIAVDRGDLSAAPRSLGLGAIGVLSLHGEPPGSEPIGERAAELIARALEVRARTEGRVRALEEQVRDRDAHAVRAEPALILGVIARGVALEIAGPLGATQIELKRIVDALDRAAARASGLGQIPRALTDQVRDGVGDAFLALERTARLAEELAHLAISGQTSPFDFNALVRTAMRLTRHRLAPTTRLRTDYATLPPIGALPGRLLQALVSCLLSATEAARGGGEIAIRTRRQPGRAVLEIELRGATFPPGTLFDPFHASEGGEGAGLGLRTVRQILGELGGEVEVDHERAEKARVTLWIPIV